MGKERGRGDGREGDEEGGRKGGRGRGGEREGDREGWSLREEGETVKWKVNLTCAVAAVSLGPNTE